MHMAIIVPKGFADLPLQVSLLIHLLYLYLAMPTSLCRGETKRKHFERAGIEPGSMLWMFGMHPTNTNEYSDENEMV